MSEADFLVKLRDGATMIADAAQERLEKLGPKESSTDASPDLSMIAWKPVAGPRGPFEIAETEANKNAAFERLTAYLSGHAGKATISDYFVWQLTGSQNIGRKPKQR